MGMKQPYWRFELLIDLPNFSHTNLGAFKGSFRVILQGRVVVLGGPIGQGEDVAAAVVELQGIQLIQLDDFKGQLEC